MRHYYLDTSVVVSWSCAAVESPSAIDTICAERIEALLADESIRIAISELTLIELHDTLSRLWRDTAKKQYDESWTKASMSMVMEAIAVGRLEIISPPPKASEHAMLLVTLATRDHGLKFKAWDATHLITASGWAHQLDEPVVIVTADADFDRFLSNCADFRAVIQLELLED